MLTLQAEYQYILSEDAKDDTYSVTVCLPCCRLASDTGVSADVAPDYTVASVLRL